MGGEHWENLQMDNGRDEKGVHIPSFWPVKQREKRLDGSEGVGLPSAHYTPKKQ